MEKLRHFRLPNIRNLVPRIWKFVVIYTVCVPTRISPTKVALNRAKISYFRKPKDKSWFCRKRSKKLRTIYVGTTFVKIWAKKTLAWRTAKIREHSANLLLLIETIGHRKKNKLFIWCHSEISAKIVNSFQKNSMGNELARKILQAENISTISQMSFFPTNDVKFDKYRSQKNFGGRDEIRTRYRRRPSHCFSCASSERYDKNARPQ